MAKLRFASEIFTRNIRVPMYSESAVGKVGSTTKFAPEAQASRRIIDSPTTLKLPIQYRAHLRANGLQLSVAESQQISIHNRVRDFLWQAHAQMSMGLQTQRIELVTLNVQRFQKSKTDEVLTRVVTALYPFELRRSEFRFASAGLEPATSGSQSMYSKSAVGFIWPATKSGSEFFC